jgi:hypothetical protein
LVWKYTIWQPWSRAEVRIKHFLCSAHELKHDSSQPSFSQH